jgi:hypothetical protein
LNGKTMSRRNKSTLSHPYSHDAILVTLAIAFCLATLPLLAHTDTSKYGLERIPDSELSFPEDHLFQRQEAEDEDLILTVVDDQEDDEKESDVVSENTPLISASLDV